ncbi:MAG: hypothetical protein IJ730_00255 [Alphaproteobacteria bacterium]|nr:hypothetical protein [Alphaproteobacteria bacterium]
MLATIDYFFTISREMFERNRKHPSKKEEDHDKHHTPKAVIQCKEIFTSKMDGFGEAAPCLEMNTASERMLQSDSSGQLSGDGHVTLQDVIVCMKYGSWGPKIQAAVIEGHKLEKIIVKRFITLHKEIVIIQETTFWNCSMKKYTQDGDLIVFAFSFIRGEDTNIHYDEKGQKQGVTSMDFDTSTLKVSSKG